MDFEFSQKVLDLQARLKAFMAEHVWRGQPVYLQIAAAPLKRWEYFG